MKAANTWASSKQAQRIIIGIGIVAAVALVWAMVVVLPDGIDWRQTYRPAALALLSFKTPYSMEVTPVAPFVAAPWGLIPLIPLALLPLKVGRAVLMLISLLAYAYTAYTWLPLETAGQAFNGTFLDSLWTLAALALLLAGFIVTPLLRFPEWEWAEGLLLFWLVGQVAQLLLPDLQSHIPGWGRLAALVTLPLLATLVQRQLATLPTTLRAPRKAHSTNRIPATSRNRSRGGMLSAGSNSPLFPNNPRTMRTARPTNIPPAAQTHLRA